jgi:hypothetical protein
MEDETTIVGAVRLMREIREWVNREIKDMTFEEQQRWMQEQLADKDERPAPATLREKAG